MGLIAIVESEEWYVEYGPGRSVTISNTFSLK